MLLLASGFFAIPREQQAAHCLPVLFECSKSIGCNADSVQEQEGDQPGCVAGCSG